MSLAFTLSIPLGSFLTSRVCLTNRQQSQWLPSTSTCRSSSTTRLAIVCSSDERQLSLPPRVRAFATIGGVSLTVALVNRLVNTPILTAYQARADIVAVVCGVSLLVYAAGAVEVKERGQRVRLEGTEVEFTSILEGRADSEARFVSQAALSSVQNFTSAAIFVDGRCVARQGIFRNSAPMESLLPGEAVRRVVEDNKLGYFADLRVMPTREIEFGFFPRESQAVVAVPVGDRGVAVFGADKVRPLTGTDFGWLTAICDRLGNAIAGTSLLEPSESLHFDVR